MQRLRESLTLILLTLLPLHAFAVTVVTRVFAGPNQAPLSVLSLWKEAILVAILGIGIAEIVQTKRWKQALKWDALDLCIVIIAAALILASLLSGTSVSSMIYGIRYDLIPLGAFIILRRVLWSPWFMTMIRRGLAIVAAGIALYALFTLILPDSFFAFLGYSDLHSLYVPGRPIAAFQHIGGSAVRRLQGTFSGPNQFGIWLALAIPFVLASRAEARRWMTPLILLALLLTFSRAAWIAAAVILVIEFWPHIRRLPRKIILSSVGGAVGIIVIAALVFPSVVLRVASSSNHITRPLEAIGVMFTEPFGRGLGSAGPASNRTSDACVDLPAGSDSSWTIPHTDLCVFVGGAQIQPTTRPCNCPFLPENWYLQIGVEGGWIAFVAFVLLILITLRTLHRSNERFARSVFLALLGVSIAALVLHAWEDSAVAYTIWIVAAVTLHTRGVAGLATGGFRS